MRWFLVIMRTIMDKNLSKTPVFIYAVIRRVTTDVRGGPECELRHARPSTSASPARPLSLARHSLSPMRLMMYHAVMSRHTRVRFSQVIAKRQRPVER